MDSPTVHFFSNFPLRCFCTPLRWITEHTGVKMQLEAEHLWEDDFESEISRLADYGSVHSWFICLNLPMMPSMSSTVMQLASTVEDYCVCVQLMHLLLSSLSLMMTLVSFSFPFSHIWLYCSPSWCRFSADAFISTQFLLTSCLQSVGCVCVSSHDHMVMCSQTCWSLGCVLWWCVYCSSSWCPLTIYGASFTNILWCI